MRHLRQALRALRASPGFTAVALLSLALGIGATTAMVGVIRTLLVTPLPVEAPEELAVVAWRSTGSPRVGNYGSTDYPDPDGGASYRSNFSYPTYEALRDGAPEGVDVFAFAFLRGVSVALGDQPAFLVGGALADGRYFSALRPEILVGRPLTEADDTPGAPVVAVLGHSLWMRAFGGDPSVVGRTVRVNGVPVEIVGVTGEGFGGLSMGGFFPRTEITVPLAARPVVLPRMAPGADLRADEETLWLRLMARVRAGVDGRTADQALTAALRSRPSPLSSGDVVSEVRSLDGRQGAQPVGEETARLLYFLLAAVALVLLIACINLASLMLARGMARRREVAVRRALGASRGRVVAEMLVESLLLAGAGTVLALVLVFASRDVVGALLTGSLGAGAFGGTDLGLRVDAGVLAVSALVGVGATLLFGVAPAVRLSDLDPGAWLKGRTAGAARRLTGGRVLISLQLGISMPLVVGAALFLRTVANLGSVELGFEPEGLATFQVDPAFTRRPASDNALLYQEVLAAVREVPGVRSVTLLENALMGGIVSNGVVTIEGERHVLFRNAIGPDFLATMGMRLLEGRMPGVQDGPDAPRVAVVNERAVEEMFGGASPVGRTLEIGGPPIEIVGVVNDTPYRSRRAGVPPTLYESALQRGGFGGHHVVLRAAAPLASVEPLVREAIFRVDADLPVPEIRTQSDLMARTSARERVFTQLLTAFGAFALLLACVGLHGITTYSVSRRTNEIGVRVAMGARPSQILGMVLRQVLVLGGAGLLVGVPLSMAVGPVVESLLYGVAPGDPATISAGALVMLGVGLAAGAVPAWRASRLDATVALRAE